MGRKKVSEMTPDELEAHREYMRKKKAESRANRDEPEKDPRLYSDRKDDRAAYMRAHRKRKKEEKSDK